jgi:hypothetical protein
MSGNSQKRDFLTNLIMLQVACMVIFAVAIVYNIFKCLLSNKFAAQQVCAPQPHNPVCHNKSAFLQTTPHQNYPRFGKVYKRRLKTENYP